MEYSSIESRRRNLMVERRTRLEIYFDVLIAIRRGHHGADVIVYETDITRRNLDSIIESLIYLGFIEEVKVLDLYGGEMRVQYRLTARGESLMRYLIDHDEIFNGRELREFYL
jgi:predicted transcriptional regulator